MNKKDLALYVLLLLLLVACGTPNKPILIENTPPGERSSPNAGYPILADGESTNAYPPPTKSLEGSLAYPAPNRSLNENKRFAFDEAVKAGQMQVHGTGYPDTPIKIISISQAGELLGIGSTNNVGTFSVSLSRALEEQEFIGIQLGDESLLSNFLDAPGTDIPMIGFVLGQSLVQP